MAGDNLLPNVFLIFGSIFMLLLLLQFARILKSRRAEFSVEEGDINPPIPNGTPMTEIEPLGSVTTIEPRLPNSTLETWLFTITSPLIDRVTTGGERELHFLRPCSIQSLQEFPNDRENCYFEIRIIELPVTSTLTIGLAPQDSTHDQIPGKGKYSIGFESRLGFLLTTNFTHEYGHKLVPGDIIGCGYRPNSDRVFYTRNGRRYPRVVFEQQSTPMYPTIHADGPCIVEYNFGQQAFMLATANSRGYGLTAPNQLVVPPPSYAHHSMDLSLCSSRDSNSLMFSDTTSTHLLSPITSTINTSATLQPPPYIPAVSHDPSAPLAITPRAE